MTACLVPLVAPLGKRQPKTCHGARLRPGHAAAAAARCVSPKSSVRLPLVIATMMISMM